MAPREEALELNMLWWMFPSPYLRWNQLLTSPTPNKALVSSFLLPLQLMLVPSFIHAYGCRFSLMTILFLNACLVSYSSRWLRLIAIVLEFIGEFLYGFTCICIKIPNNICINGLANSLISIRKLFRLCVWCIMRDFDSTWKHHSHFTKCCRYAVMEQRQPLFLHPKRQHADCPLDMGYMPPWACRCACAERSNPCCSMGPYLHTPCFMHREPSLVHVDAIRCLLCQHPLAELPNRWFEVELKWKLSPPEGPRIFLLCHNHICPAWGRTWSIWWYFWRWMNDLMVCLAAYANGTWN